VLSLATYRAVFTSFLNALSSSNLDIYTEKWYAKRGDAEALTGCATYTEKQCGETWSAELQKLCAAVKEASAPDSSLTDPKILTEKALQDLILKNTRKKELPDAVVSLGRAMGIAKDSHSRGFFPDVLKTAYKAATHSKKMGKMALGVEYALDEVINNGKSTPKETTTRL